MAKKASKLKVPTALEGINELSRAARIDLTNDILKKRPTLLKEFMPKWWYFAKCEVNVLLVTDGGLDFGLSDFGLSEFIDTFRQLEQESVTNIKYKVTLAHRKSLLQLQNQGVDPMLMGNNTIHNRINSFNFASSVTLSSFDQVWIFGVGSNSSGLPLNERTAITNYMNGGGGLFTTGDHGSLGSALCSNIPRVEDMRIWANTSSDNNLNEVSMDGMRRNDTNMPQPGSAVSTIFDNQSDNIPQNIAVRTFGAGNPHPLLSISTSKRPSGIIDIMPDHPHEGECKQETSFTVNHPNTGVAHTISSQIIATSFVRGGNTAPGKDPTLPHCFPSISVWDGRPAAHGRIAIDSTWHHFVNTNINGIGGGVGLDQADFDVIQQYYMNTAKWISRRKIMLCTYKFTLIHLLKSTQIIESSMDFPETPFDKIRLKDLHSIGSLAKEIIASESTPAFAKDFEQTMLEEINPELAELLDDFKPSVKQRKDPEFKLSNDLVNFDRIVGIAVGSGFIALRDNEKKIDSLTEKSFERVTTIFMKGAAKGMDRAVTAFNKDLQTLTKSLVKRKASRTISDKTKINLRNRKKK